jgi:sialidase-1
LRQPGIKADEITYNNPLVIANRESGTVHLLFSLEYARCFYQRSDDDGRTYSPPVEIASTLQKFRPEYAWQVLATGPGHGIRLKSGRLIVPVWLSTATGANVHHPSVIATIYSDDDGKSWQRGAIITGEREPLVDPNESQAVELADGRVMFNIRSLSPPNRRAVSISPDGISDWSTPTFDEALVDPICMASLCRLTTTADSDRNRLLFSNPANLERAKGEVTPGGSRDRKNLTVRLSYDEGKTWPVARALEPGPSAYSDLAVAPDGTIYCLYEKRSKGGKNSIYLARFNLQWLSEGQDRLAN